MPLHPDYDPPNLDDLKRHPLSALCGDMPPREFQEIVQSVADHGLTDKNIWMLDDMILDGWHRYHGRQAGSGDRAVCSRRGGRFPLHPSRQHEPPRGALKTIKRQVIQRNALRRHMTVSQRAAVVAAVVKWTPTLSVPDSTIEHPTGSEPGYAPGCVPP